MPASQAIDGPLNSAATADGIRERGFVFRAGRDVADALGITTQSEEWRGFAESWNRLVTDSYMADGGRYRRRRHTVVHGTRDGLESVPHQAHFQGLEFNALNGGIQRWFEPVDPAVIDRRPMRSIIGYAQTQFSALSPQVSRWKIEVHQFRIEASTEAAGKPTPEGMHRDGVDYVLVLMIARNNITSGTTLLADLNQSPIGEFTLTDPLDAVLLDDRRVLHGVTPITPSLETLPSSRDVLVVTFLAI